MAQNHLLLPDGHLQPLRQLRSLVRLLHSAAIRHEDDGDAELPARCVQQRRKGGLGALEDGAASDHAIDVEHERRCRRCAPPLHVRLLVDITTIQGSFTRGVCLTIIMVIIIIIIG